MADCILRNRDISEDVSRLRSEYTEMKYCFGGKEFDEALGNLLGTLGM